MGKGCNQRYCVFPLTSLQIGDLQSYLSHLSLFLAPESKKFYILVDNRPWLKDLVSRPAHLWQLMVTKSRLSPFANRRKQKERKETGGFFEVKSTSKLNTSKSRKFRRWFSVIDAASLSRKRALLPVKKLRTSLILNSKLHRTLYGFIVFEVVWSDVRGINYLNELQTDTSLAIESKFMKRWEFDSITQAARCISSWFLGTLTERVCLREHLEAAIDWIETWEMVSRIKYLGTMLFLHNSQKAVEWFLMTMRTIRTFLRVLTQPVAGPIVVFWQILLPFWDMFINILESFCTFTWFVVATSFSLVENLAETILLPVWFILAVLWNIATSFLYPIFWILCEILYAPFRLVLGLSSLLAFIFRNAYDLIWDIWLFVSSIFQLASNADATVSSYEVSMWRTLWNDLFSQVFRAVRSILNGFVAFFTACNRHRLSIYNHVLDFIQRLSRPSLRLQPTDSSRRIQISEIPNLSDFREERPHQMKHLKQKQR